MKTLGISLMSLNYAAMTYNVETGLEDIIVSLVIIGLYVVLPGLVASTLLKTTWGLLKRKSGLVS